jgi:hypothetical protein
MPGRTGAAARRLAVEWLPAVIVVLGCRCGGDGTDDASGPDDAVVEAEGPADDAADADGDVPGDGPGTEDGAVDGPGAEDASADEPGAEDVPPDDPGTGDDGLDASIIADGEDSGGADDGGTAGGCRVLAADLPCVHDFSSASAAHLESLVRRAIAGLGFGAGDGPNASDRFFVGRHYMAWIDETGFYGKMNGLWRLDGRAGDGLDFAVTDVGGRPVNFFVPGEDGDGAWPAGYPGGEHIEFPNRTPEADDDRRCASSDWCNQYGMNEAPDFTDPDIPWWSSCNGGAPSWSERFSAVEETTSAGGVRLVYEGPLVKEADGDGRWDGDSCHRDWLFADGVRRRVDLRVGFELYADERYVDRLMQFVNPEGNPPFEGPMSLIGGFVVTDWPGAHYTKRLERWLRPELRDVEDTAHGIVLRAASWTAHPSDPLGGDEVISWLGQPISMSGFDEFVPGRTATLAHFGPSDNDDVGICLCRVHGGIEMGGGLIHGGISLPIAGGASSIEARRRLTLGGEPDAVAVHVYEAETDLSHHGDLGRAEADGWSASTGADDAGHMSYGPYAVDWGERSVQAVFELQVDNNTADDRVVVTVDVNDAAADQVVASREVRRREFRAPSRYQAFAVDASLAGRAGHRMEARVYWHDVSYVKLDRVVVTTVP